MAKQRHQDVQKDSSKTTLVVMVVGALLVAGLVGWALTRTVETSPVTPVATEQFPTSTVPAASGTSGTGGFIADAGTGTNTGAGTNAFDTNTAGTSAPLGALPPSGPVGDRATVARVAPEDLRNQISSGAVTVVDVRDANSFAASHIPGSIHIPFASVEGMIDEIPKGKPIVTYCT